MSAMRSGCGALARFTHQVSHPNPVGSNRHWGRYRHPSRTANGVTGGTPAKTRQKRAFGGFGTRTWADTLSEVTSDLSNRGGLLCRGKRRASEKLNICNIYGRYIVQNRLSRGISVAW